VFADITLKGENADARAVTSHARRAGVVREYR
jgi:hypothetical protein